MAPTSHRSEWRRMFQHDQTQQKSSQETTTSPPRKQPAYKNGSLASKYRDAGKELGDGAGGRVCVMTRRSDNKTVAIKGFRRRRPSEDRTHYARQIIAEYYIGSKLNHINIIQNLELLEEPADQWYQVMEYAPHNLFDRVASGRMSVEEIRCSFAQVCVGVAYLHAMGFAHRDLKLENVVYTEQGVMKVIDFGVAATCKVDDEERPTEEVGCRPYMAPELFTRTTYGPKLADVWSLGVLYCTMVLGSFPWKEACGSDRRFARFRAEQQSHQAEAQLNTTRGHLDIEKDNAVSVTTIELTPTPSSSGKSSSTSSISEHSNITPTHQQSSTQRNLPDTPLLDKLPSQSRSLISSILQITPRQRKTMKQICASTFVSESDSCVRSHLPQGRDPPHARTGSGGHRHT